MVRRLMRWLRSSDPCPSETHEDAQEARACALGEPIPRSLCDPYLQLGHFEQAPCEDGLFRALPHYYKVARHKERDGQLECIVAGGRCAIRE